MYGNAAVIGDPLHTLRLGSGDRKIFKPLIIRSLGRFFVVPDGMITDYSSYPRVWLVLAVLVLVALTGNYWFIALLAFVPSFSKTDISGCLHDYLFAVGFNWWRANLHWYDVSISGSERSAKAGRLVAAFSLVGLMILSWVPYLRWKVARGEASRLETFLSFWWLPFGRSHYQRLDIEKLKARAAEVLAAHNAGDLVA